MGFPSGFRSCAPVVLGLMPRGFRSCAPAGWKKQKASSTLRTSRAVTHPSTIRAFRRLTSEFGWDPVFSTQYGRWQRLVPPTTCHTPLNPGLEKIASRWTIIRFDMAGFTTGGFYAGPVLLGLTGVEKNGCCLDMDRSCTLSQDWLGTIYIRHLWPEVHKYRVFVLGLNRLSTKTAARGELILEI